MIQEQKKTADNTCYIIYNINIHDTYIHSPQLPAYAPLPYEYIFAPSPRK